MYLKAENPIDIHGYKCNVEIMEHAIHITFSIDDTESNEYHPLTEMSTLYYSYNHEFPTTVEIGAFYEDELLTDLIVQITVPLLKSYNVTNYKELLYSFNKDVYKRYTTHYAIKQYVISLVQFILLN